MHPLLPRLLSLDLALPPLPHTLGLLLLVGIAIKNNGVVPLPESVKPGLTFATKTVLQTGIVCVAAKLSFFELLSTGSSGIPVVLGAVGAGLVTIPMMGTFAGLPRKMSLLLTAGTSICGVTAITALAPAIEAEKRDVAVAVANTVAFGTVGMLAYPYIFNALCTSSEQVGMCLGVAIHDTSQVLGSAMSYRETFDDEIALRVAAVTKLTRNLGLAIAIPMLTFIHKKEVGAGEVKSSYEDTMSGLATFKKYVPPFLVAFIGMAGLRSTGDLIMDPEVNQLYFEAVSFVGSDLSKYALGTAMAGVGLSTDAASLKGVGWKPFAVGGAGALIVGGTGFTIASMIV
ncbi:hypothetical protein TrVE_jg5825 [Triparma verrucosa]|uniref:Sulfate exporter family transporter n=1 Tax=Triparma verrucosa TaxID=1606542 RepID=A0A9W7FBW6_9STRA|nr:hypothetical protein TrVE_jg5825 [Triparma verrucosa]